MSIADQVTRIKNNIDSAYTGLENKGTIIPLLHNSAKLRETIESIKTFAATIVYSQMNKAVADYTEEVTYDPGDYTSSCLSTYVIPTDYDKGKPSGAGISVPEAGILTLTDSCGSLSYSVPVGNHTVYNLTPGTVGSYIVKNSNDQVICAGLLKPTGSLRMINATATNNIRDLGGWACDGGAVKYGLLFRGGEVSASDAALFHDLLGIRAELNLRWDSEVSGDSSLIGSDVDFKHISGPWYTIGAGENWLPDAHKQILNYAMDKAIAGIPLYFHCSAGADRTGTVAFLLEALLGMSQSDTDKDYELTSFFTGIDTDANARRRDEDAWKNYMAQFNAYQGNNMRDKVVNWALTIGITIDKINAFRAAMINGTPEVLTGDVGSVSVTRSLTGVSTDNTANTNARYQPYKASLTPDPGKVITAVRITMGGLDITGKVFSGNETTYKHSVSFGLTNCSLATLPQRKAVVDRECFCCTLEADEGYSLKDEDNPTVSITMGGVNMATYYKDGIINIPKVTGDLVINVTAAASAVSYTNQIAESTAEIGGSALYNSTGYKNDYRYSSSMAESANSGCFTTGYIHLTKGDIVRFYGNIFSGTNGGFNSAFYQSDGTKVTQITPQSFSNNNLLTTFTNNVTSVDYDSTNNILHSFVWNANYDVWVKFTLVGTFSEGTTVITVNEEM